MRAYILTEDQFNTIASCVLDGDRCLDENIEIAVELCQTLLPSDPIFWAHVSQGKVFDARVASVVPTEFYNTALFALEQSK